MRTIGRPGERHIKGTEDGKSRVARERVDHGHRKMQRSHEHVSEIMATGATDATRRLSSGAWMRSNLTTQGYCLSDAERRELSLALRFSTGLCLSLVLVALVIESPAMVFGLSGIGLIAGFSARHPFDHLWNRFVRHAFGGPALPPNPARRRHAFKVATGWLAIVGGLLYAGATVAALLLGALLVAACATVTAANLCIPSEALAWWERRTARKEAPPYERSANQGLKD